MIKLYRTLREGLRSVYRDGWLSFATISVLTLSLSIIAMTFLLVAAGTFVLRGIQDNVTISAYMYPSVTPERVEEIATELRSITEIAEVSYVPREEALREFKDTTRDPVIREALEMFEKDGENPLYSALVIKATDPVHYDAINQLLHTSQYENDIVDVNFSKNQDIINRINTMLSLTRKLGMTLGAVFVTIAILMVYNTVRITMFARRHEFEVMRLVGASNTYVRLPSVFEGIFYGIAAALATIVLLGIVTYVISPFLRDFFGDVSLFAVALHYAWDIVFLTLIAGIVLGMLSGMIAIRRYLRT